MTTATGSFQITSMGEDPYEELEDGGKLTRANGTQRFTGDIRGDGTVEWLMCYGADGTARYVGLQQVTGSVDEREGSFVMEASGYFDGTSSKGTWRILEGSGTGDLEEIRGKGSFEAPSGPRATFSLDYRLA